MDLNSHMCLQGCKAAILEDLNEKLNTIRIAKYAKTLNY